MTSFPLPTTTRAAILVAQRQPLVIDEIGLPPALDVGQVLVAFAWSGICGSQIGEIDGVKGPDPWLPHLLGHEACGTVLAIGPGVQHVAVHDTVAAHWRPGRGIEARPARYTWRGESLHAGRVATFSHHAVVSENRLTPVPAATDPRVAALCGCAITTGFGVVEGRARVRLGDRVVVCGSGGVGLAVVRGAWLAGARAIVAVDRFANRLGLARQLGATHAIDVSATPDWAAAAAELLGGSADVVIDTTGDPRAIAAAYGLAGSHGRLVLVGVPRSDATVSLPTLPLHHGRTIVGTEGGDGDPDEAIPRYLALAAARGVDLADMISDVGPLEDVNSLIDRMRDGRAAGRCLIDLNA